jgi:predicted RNA binding protein YcfA (HicA-like mRNA interferase family)
LEDGAPSTPKYVDTLGQCRTDKLDHHLEHDMDTRYRLLSLSLAAAIAMPAIASWSSWSRAEQTSQPDHARHMEADRATVPTMPGQDAFGTIQEIVRILEADPRTDWSRVNIAALREHLIDMNEVTLHAKAGAERVDGGLRITVTGTGRTLEAIRRMIPAHAREIDGRAGWSVTTSPVTDGVVLTVSATDPSQAVRIRGLGFIGVMVRGAHHQPHHLAMARGAFRH